jgi:hypothetical protein
MRPSSSTEAPVLVELSINRPMTEADARALHATLLSTGLVKQWSLDSVVKQEAGEE